MRAIKFRAWDGKKLIPYEDMLLYDSHSETPTSFVMSLRGTPYNYQYMQYTGLHDKNGVDIYESDIVQAFNRLTTTTTRTRHVIRWNSETARFNGVPLTHEPEVIGNIYENPELLK